MKRENIKREMITEKMKEKEKGKGRGSMRRDGRGRPLTPMDPSGLHRNY